MSYLLHPNYPFNFLIWDTEGLFRETGPGYFFFWLKSPYEYNCAGQFFFGKGIQEFYFPH